MWVLLLRLGPSPPAGPGGLCSGGLAIAGTSGRAAQSGVKGFGGSREGAGGGGALHPRSASRARDPWAQEVGKVWRGPWGAGAEQWRSALHAPGPQRMPSAGGGRLLARLPAAPASRALRRRLGIRWLGGESGSPSRGAETKARSAAPVPLQHRASGCRGVPGHSGSAPLPGLLLLPTATRARRRPRRTVSNTSRTE